MKIEQIIGDEKIVRIVGDFSNIDITNLSCDTKEVINGTLFFCLKGNKVDGHNYAQNAKELGAKRVIELKTSGPFHTEKLQKASIELKKELKKIDFKNFEISVIKNLNGEKYEEADDMADILAKHVVNPVKFGKSIEKMTEMGIDTFIEIGPGKTLSGFVKKVCKKLEKEVNVFNIENIETLETTLQALK